MDFGAMRSGAGEAAGPGKATALRLRRQLGRVRGGHERAGAILG
jgi:hypothetical protein